MKQIGDRSGNEVGRQKIEGRSGFAANYHPCENFCSW